MKPVGQRRAVWRIVSAILTGGLASLVVHAIRRIFQHGETRDEGFSAVSSRNGGSLPLTGELADRFPDVRPESRGPRDESGSEQTDASWSGEPVATPAVAESLPSAERQAQDSADTKEIDVNIVTPLVYDITSATLYESYVREQLGEVSQASSTSPATSTQIGSERENGLHDAGGGPVGEPRVASRRRAPEKRGGRPRREILEEPKTRGGHKVEARFEEVPFIVRCRREGLEWVIGLEPLEDGLTFFQEGQQLEAPRVVDRFFPLRSDAEVRVRDRHDGESTWCILSGPHLFFCLDSPSEGVLIEESDLLKGETYLLLCLGEHVKGLQAEPIALPGWSAYFLIVDEMDELVIGARRVRFDERGRQRLHVDVSGERIPGVDDRYRAFADVSGFRWKAAPRAVRTVVVRLERGRRAFTRWWSVSGEETEIPEAIRSELREIGAGRFAVRCYDEEDQLVVSGDFRLAVGLRSVKRVHQASGEVTVEFELEPGYRVEPLYPGIERFCDNPPLYVIRVDQRQEHLHWWDLMEWEVVAPSQNTITIGVDLERLVWALADEKESPSPAEWGNTALRLERADFAALSRKVLWIWSPPHKKKHRLHVAIKSIGQEASTAAGKWFRQRKQGLPLFAVPLRELQYLLPERSGEYAVVLKLPDRSVEVAQFTARLRCQLCGYSSENEEHVWHHIVVFHDSELFDPVSALEIWSRQGKQLPDRVYVCRYCQKGFPEYGVENGNTAVGEHQRRECEAARAQAGSGPIEERIAVLERGVDDERMIQALVGRKRRCRRCGAEIDPGLSRQHLRSEHAAELVELC